VSFLTSPSNGQLLQALQATTKPISVPAPTGGVNRTDSLTNMAPNDAIFMYNMIPSEFGTRVRTGYTEFANNIHLEAGTIIPFTGSTVANDRLFATGDDGIYDISAGGVMGAPVLAFPVADSHSPFGIWTNYTNSAGNFSLLTNETNGYYVYTEGAGTWAKIAMGVGATQIAGVDPNNLVMLTIYKSRIWFVEKNSARAWYLPADAIYGTATVFNFGNKFKHGGTLAALYNWTVDGGEGVNDYLVAISTGGDVVVYLGDDPASATTFAQKGVWFIGPPPTGRRIAGSFGGELYLLSQYGLIPMSKLIAGSLVQQEDTNFAKKVSPLINAEMTLTRETHGWEVKLVPTENLLLISSPKRSGIDYQQFVYSLNTPGWAVYREVPYLTGELWHGIFYFSDETGKVYIHQGNLDNVNIAGTTFELINWSLLMPFFGYGADGFYHRIQFIRAIFLAAQAPSYSTEARYDYDLDEALAPPSASVVTGAVWDTALWDIGLWTGDFTPVEAVRGGDGMGRVMSIGLNGSSGSRTILVKFDLLADQGGML
jgi:hypothetical protein